MKFSIIVPVYNVKPFLRECLDSVRAQAFEDWECVCVDDGSDDGSGDILDEYAEEDPRFRIIHQTNSGVSVARNRALELVRGDYIGFLDGDDALSSDWLRTVARILERRDYDLVRLRPMKWDGGERCDNPIGNAAGTEMLGERNVLLWGWATFTREGWSCVNFIKRILLSGIRYPVGMKMQEDNIFTLRILRNRMVAAYQSEFEGYFYRQREGAATSSTFPLRSCIHFVDLLAEEFNAQAALFGESAINAVRRDFSICLARTLKNWMVMRDPSERPRYAELRERLVKLMREHLMCSMDQLPLKRRIQFWSFVRFGICLQWPKLKRRSR